MTGSSKLTKRQQRVYLRRFGLRYLAVQENPLQPSRRVRRALTFGHGISADDRAVLDWQTAATRPLLRKAA